MARMSSQLARTAAVTAARACQRRRRRFAQHRPAEAVGDDQARRLGQDLARKLRRHGEVEGVAIGAVLGPLAVDPVVFQARLHLGDGDLPARPERHQVGPPAVGQAHLGQGRIAQGQEQPRRAARHRVGGLGPGKHQFEGFWSGPVIHPARMFRFRSESSAYEARPQLAGWS